MNSEETIRKSIHGSHTPNIKQRPSNFITNSIGSLITIFFGIFFSEEGQQHTKALKDIDEGRVRQEEEDNKGPVIEVQSHLTFKDIMVESDRDEEVGAYMNG